MTGNMNHALLFGVEHSFLVVRIPSGGDEAVSSHHYGHFTYKACAISSTQEIPTQACFDANPLTFVEDLLYGAPIDQSYPERAYIAPVSHPNAQTETIAGQSGMRFSHKVRLPSDVSGNLVLIQWQYITANSCFSQGYNDYPFPDASWWNSAVGVCQTIPADGVGTPEQASFLCFAIVLSL